MEEPISLSLLPEEDLIYILQELSDLRSMLACSCVSYDWNLILTGMWKFFCERDFPGFVETRPASSQQFQDAQQAVTAKNTPRPLWPDNPYAALLQATLGLRPDSFEPLVQDYSFPDEGDWKALYPQLMCFPNLNGVWTAMYGSHGMEFLRFEQTGFKVSGLKLKGDVNVPAGQKSFEVVFTKNPKHAVGRIHLAETGYVNPYTEFASLEMVNPTTCHVHWFLGWGHVSTLTFHWSELHQDYQMGRPETEDL